MGPLTIIRTISLSALPMLGLAAQPTPAASFKDAYLSQLEDAEKKVVALAEALPQDKYSWRPEEGVRSVSEVFMHIASANYGFLMALGVKLPEGLDRNMEKLVTEKPKVLDKLKASFDFARATVNGLSDADLMKETKFFGGKMATYEAILFSMANHLHEHLGQAIAYARTNHVTPPWSKKEG